MFVHDILYTQINNKRAYCTYRGIGVIGRGAPVRWAMVEGGRVAGVGARGRARVPPVVDVPDVHHGRRTALRPAIGGARCATPLVTAVIGAWHSSGGSPCCPFVDKSRRGLPFTRLWKFQEEVNLFPFCEKFKGRENCNPRKQ